MRIIASSRFKETNVEVANYVNKFARGVEPFNCIIKIRKESLGRIVLSIQYATNNILFVRYKNFYPERLELRIRRSFNYGIIKILTNVHSHTSSRQRCRDILKNIATNVWIEINFLCISYSGFS